MSAAEILTAEVGGFLLASEVIAAVVARSAIRHLCQAIEHNWLRGGASLGIAAPDARWPAPRKARTAPKTDGDQPRESNGRFTAKAEPLHETGTEAA